jgi:hypothetical protein
MPLIQINETAAENVTRLAARTIIRHPSYMLKLLLTGSTKILYIRFKSQK